MASIVEAAVRTYLYTQSLTLGAVDHHVTIQDLDPAGLIIRASHEGSSLEYTLNIPEHEVSKTGERG